MQNLILGKRDHLRLYFHGFFVWSLTIVLALYKFAKGLRGCDAQELFDKYCVLSYINEVYDVLHSASDSYIISDIDIYINARKEIA